MANDSNGSAITGTRTVIVTVALSALVIGLATAWRIAGADAWMLWLALAALPGLALQWVQIVRRTRWFYPELAALAATGVILFVGWQRTQATALAGLAACCALILAYRLWKRMAGPRGGE